MFEVDFKVLRTKDGRIIGISLIAKPHTDSEVFCATFPMALKVQKADIRLENGEIVFDHPINGRYAIKLTSEDYQELNKLAYEDKKKFILVPDGFLSPGFKIFVAE